ncbi:MAG: 3-isopropylmalate dehydratase large subunit [Candidatus Caenarcaniphilales bacterium]|jgi:3-isopropylmalate/(R)-2-methylmalate dehydratase large subunit|nr:3-isopropylmalate dehydratase large subunit [Candidatus Caenarcaniphilales bacterium]
MPKTLFDKVWENHVVEKLPGNNYLVFMDRIIAHEITTPQGAIQIDEEFGGRIFDSEKILAINDHVAPAKDTATAIQADVLRKWSKKHNIRHFDIGENGICHVVAPERGYVQPGMTLCCGDSHTCTNGAFACFALGIGTTANAGAMLSQCLLLQKPKVMQINITGKRKPGVFAKDIILAIINKISFRGGTGYVLEYTGDAIKDLDMEERMTICNMAIEAGATSGMIEADEVTFEYLKGKEQISGQDFETLKAKWSEFKADPGAVYDTTVELDISQLEPMVTWGINPGEACGTRSAVPQDAENKALEYMGLKTGDKISELELDQAFIGSCTNARISDLRIAAEILKGQKVKIPTIITPGSQLVKRQAEKEGLHDIFQDAGALWTHASCGPCLGMSMGVVAPQNRCISSTNRNFPGRMGAGARTHLASPATVAASAIYGKIISAKDLAELKTKA